MLFSQSRDLIAFYRQLGGLYRSGIAPVEALPLAAGHVTNRAVREATQALHRSAFAGEPISTACAGYPGVFSTVDVALIVAGEQHGRLDRSFDQLADLAEREYKGRRRLLFGMAYPAFLLVLAWLLPSLSVFVTEGPAAYLTTVTTTSLPFLVVIGGSVAGYLLFRNAARQAFDRVVLMVPVIGPAMRDLALARFSRGMSLVYAGSGDLRKSLTLAIGVIGNTHLAWLCHGVKWRLDDGATLTQSLSGTRIFPVEDIASIAVAERSGTLDSMFEVMAQRHEEQADRSIKTLLVTVPLAVYLMVALYIGYVVIRFYAGYFSQLDQIK